MGPEGKKPGNVRREAAGIGPSSPDHGYLDGQLLVAMPVMGDPRFEVAGSLLENEDEVCYSAVASWTRCTRSPGAPTRFGGRFLM